MVKSIPFRPRVRLIEAGCPITLMPLGSGRSIPKCGKPLQRGAKFCVKHEADRIRLS